MNIVISCHFDLAEEVKFLKIQNGSLHGIVDNFAGVFTAYKAQRATQIPLYLTNYEEKPGYLGAVEVANILNKEDTLVIVVDTCTDVQEKEAYIGNAYNVNVDLLKKEFGSSIFFKPGLYEEDMDETYIYGHEKGYKTFFFGVPIEGEYHSVDNKIPLSVMDKAAKLLEDIIVWIQHNPEFYTSSGQ